MPTSIRLKDIDRCPKCRNIVHRQQSDHTFWCSCGRHWSAEEAIYDSAEEPETAPTSEKIVVEVPDIEKPRKKPVRGKNKQITQYTFENRALYLHRNNLTEVEIITEPDGREYWIKDNFYAGTSQKIYLPERYKKAKKPL